MNILDNNLIGECKDINRLTISHIAEIHKTQYDLPKGALKENNGLYILTGRDRGIQNGSTNEPHFIQGNPLDIFATYIKNKDFYSTNSCNIIMNNLRGNRKLIPIRDLNRLDKKGSFSKDVEFYYDGKVLKPRDIEISPTKINPVDEIYLMKGTSGFSQMAKNYLDASPREIDSLIQYLF